MSAAASDSGRPAGLPTLRDVIRCMRPNQWTKNGVVLAAFFFAFWDKGQSVDVSAGLTLALPAVLLFCLVSSGIYIVNDLRDIEQDQQHPTKRYRPLAAGRVSPAVGWVLALVLLAVALGGSLVLSVSFASIVSAYVAIQLIYSFGLKRVALVDVFVIATGFVLRAIAGALVLTVSISSWLLLCTFLLALFLALCKRRHEKLFIEEGPGNSRSSLEAYDAHLLDLLISISASATIVCYAIYTLSAETIAKFGTERLGFTVPFVIFGVFRYLDLAYRHEKGERPERILLTDIPILVNLALYGMTLLLIFRLGA